MKVWLVEVRVTERQMWFIAHWADDRVHHTRKGALASVLRLRSKYTNQFHFRARSYVAEKGTD